MFIWAKSQLSIADSYLTIPDNEVKPIVGELQKSKDHFEHPTFWYKRLTFFLFSFFEKLRAEKCGTGRGKPRESTFGRLSRLSTTSPTLVRARFSKKESKLLVWVKKHFVEIFFAASKIVFHA